VKIRGLSNYKRKFSIGDYKIRNASLEDIFLMPKAHRVTINFDLT